MVTISIVEIAMYIYYVVDMNDSVRIDGPVPIHSELIYNPYKRREAWRFLTYMFVHIGIYHIIFNVLTQLVLGIPLEMVHSWRIIFVYLMGVIAGSLAVSVTDPKVYLAGASGGVYALIAAHVANLVVNWDEMEFAVFRLIFLLVLIGADVGVALYNYYSGIEKNKVSYVAHFGGFIAGLLMGIVVLRNFKKKTWERVVWWIALVGFIVLVVFCIIWNIAAPEGMYYKQQ